MHRLPARTFILHDRPTSVRLEPELWQYLRVIAAELGTTSARLQLAFRRLGPTRLAGLARLPDPESRFSFRLEKRQRMFMASNYGDAPDQLDRRRSITR
jgi:hypothetical protein